MPAASSDLLSAEEAKGRLRKIVEEFFFRRGRQGETAARHLLVRSPPGLGKTKEAMEWATRYQAEQDAAPLLEICLDDVTEGGAIAQTAVFVPRHALALEIKEVIESNLAARGRPVAVQILRGRDHRAEHYEAPCQRWREAGELGRKGLPVYSNLCRRSQERQIEKCPHFDDCDYIRAWTAAHSAPFVILVHSYLGVEWDSAGIVYGGSTFDRDDRAEAFAVPHRRFNPTQAAIIVCDEDPTQSLIERRYLKKDALCSITDGGLGELISAGLDAPSGLLSYLHSAAISPERMRAAAETLRFEEWKRGQVTNPSAPSADVGKAAAEAAPLARLSRVLDRLADELACGRAGPAYSLLVSGDGLIVQGRKPWAFDEQRLLVLDGTANPEIMRQFVPTLAAEPEIRVERNARIIQVKNATFYKGSLIRCVSDANGRGKPEPTERLLEVGDFIERTAQTGKTLVVTNKPVRCALTGEDQDGKLPVSSQYHGADVAHFGNLRGSNEFEGHDTVIILGRDEPSVRSAEQRAMAIWYDTQKPIDEVRLNARGRVKYRSRVGRYQMRDGSTIHARVSMHPDPRVQAVVEQGREAEMVQAIDRLRLIHNEKRKTVYILCSIPLALPVDELVTWNQLTGDRRLNDALAECDGRGWDALPLPPRELSRLFPQLWATPKAAERWIAKNPPAASNNIIRLWGVLVDYRPKRQRSWSRGLVRHGANASSALAVALGMPPEIILWRGSE